MNVLKISCVCLLLLVLHVQATSKQRGKIAARTAAKAQPKHLARTAPKAHPKHLARTATKVHPKPLARAPKIQLRNQRIYVPLGQTDCYPPFYDSCDSLLKDGTVYVAKAMAQALVKQVIAVDPLTPVKMEVSQEIVEKLVCNGNLQDAVAKVIESEGTKFGDHLCQSPPGYNSFNIRKHPDGGKCSG